MEPTTLLPAIALLSLVTVIALPLVALAVERIRV